MHELSIASNIIDAMRNYQAERGNPTLIAVGIRIGTLSDVVPDALCFGFEVLTRETDYESTELKVEHVKPRGRCRECENEFDVNDLLFVCTKCESTNVDLICGQELEIVYFETEESSASGLSS